MAKLQFFVGVLSRGSRGPPKRNCSLVI